MAFRSRELTVAGVAKLTVIAYVAFTLLALALHHGDPRWFLWIGTQFAEHDPTGSVGYDGQFFYYIARDGLGAVPYLDVPAYRLQRILFPVAARLLSAGRADLLPGVLLAIDLTAIVAATAAWARWLQRRGVSPGYALTYGFYVGTFMAYSRALAEPVAFGCASAGVLLWLSRRYGGAIVLLALAALAKETTIVCIAALGAAECAQRRPRLAGSLLLALVPFALWQGYLTLTLHQVPIVAGHALELVPLAGLISVFNLQPGTVSSVLWVAAPAVVGTAAGALLVWMHPRDYAAWLLLLQGAITLAMPAETFLELMAAARNATGLVIAVLLLFPRLSLSARRAVCAYWIFPSVLWLIPLVLQPYGGT